MSKLRKESPCKQTLYHYFFFKSLSRFSAYSRPLFIDLSMHIISHFNIAARVVSCASGLSIIFYCSHSKLRDAPSYVTLQRIENLHGFLTVFCHSTPNTYNNLLYNFDYRPVRAHPINKQLIFPCKKFYIQNLILLCHLFYSWLVSSTSYSTVRLKVFTK